MNASRPGRLLSPPAHIAIIMDGNGRWARARGLPRAIGHHRGAEAVRRTVRGAGELGIGYLTLYSFSTENWKRPTAEIEDLMGLLRRYLRSEIADLHANNVRLRVIGNRARLADDIVRLIETAETQTRDNTGLTLVIALSYGGREELVEATRQLASQAAAGQLDPAAITEDTIGAALFTHDIPDPDLVIRTSGEQRLSNFLLWQSAYAELLFVDTYWPDFGKDDLVHAIDEFHRRDRRYGALAEQ